MFSLSASPLKVVRHRSFSSNFFKLSIFRSWAFRDNNAKPISTSTCCCKAYPKRAQFDAARTARFLKNMVAGSTKSRKKYVAYDQPPSNALNEFGFISKGKARPVSGKVLRRVEVLNTLFIEQITSLLATGEVSPEFLGLGLQISRVKVAPDFSLVNVFWYASGTEKDETIEELLTRTAGHLRHVLSQLRVIGVVPPIKFHRDRTFSKFQEVETLLNKCDLGADFEPTHLSGSQSSSKEQESLETTEEEVTGKDLMRQDMLGVPHDRIMNEILTAIGKKRERKQKEKEVQVRSISDMPIEQEYNLLESDLDPGETLASEVDNHRKRQFEFLKFLKKRQAERSKEIRRNSVEAKEQEFFQSRHEERWLNQFHSQLDVLENQLIEEEEREELDREINDKEEEEYYENLRNEFR